MAGLKEGRKEGRKEERKKERKTPLFSSLTYVVSSVLTTLYQLQPSTWADETSRHIAQLADILSPA
jgi:hypothetical protein